MFSDLDVIPISDALKGKKIDLVVSGSIGAVECVKFARSLRRLGAEVFPYLTEGGKQFTTETALSWACNHPVITQFSGTSSHLCLHDALIVAPASANFIASIANGITNTPATALVSSYLGSDKKVFVLPNMHQSLADSPIFQKNLQFIASYVEILSARKEEGKQKFPSPETLADQIAHAINFSPEKPRKTFISFGTTKGFIDDVRYISNYSSGALGSLITEELYRNGIYTVAIKGPCLVTPRCYNEMIPIVTNSELDSAIHAAHQTVESGIFATSVLDYIPVNKSEGKIRSNRESMDVSFIRTEKIIVKYNFAKGSKIGFKLEANVTLEQAKSIAVDYMAKYNLTAFIVNSLYEVSEVKHKAFLFTKESQTISEPTILMSKETLATAIAKQIITN